MIEPTEAMRLAFNAARGSWFDKMRAALAVASVGGVPAKAHVRHLKRGSVYAVLGAAVAQVSVGTVPASSDLPTGRILCDDAKVVVYVGTDGRLWVRFPDEMDDGRFEPVACGELRPSGDRVTGSSDLIAAPTEREAAILAERERCSRIAEKTRPWPAMSAHAAGRAIAAEIRKGDAS